MQRNKYPWPMTIFCCQPDIDGKNDGTECVGASTRLSFEKIISC